jgi:hypothetical protein
LTSGFAGRHYAFMRTTLTLDPDVVRLLQEEQHRQRKSFKEVVNEAIRRGLAPRAAQRPRGRYRIKPHKTTLRAGVDIAAFNRLADELEDDVIVGRATRRP